MRASFDWRNIFLWGIAFGSGVIMICLGPLTLFVAKKTKRVKRKTSSCEHDF